MGKYRLLYLPLVLNGIAAYTSVFTKWMFYFDGENQFHRGPIGFLPFLISGIYLLCLLFWSFERYLQGDKKEGTIVAFMAFMSVVATGMETFLHFKFIINGVGAVSTVFIICSCIRRLTKETHLPGHSTAMHSIWTVNSMEGNR